MYTAFPKRRLVFQINEQVPIYITIVVEQLELKIMCCVERRAHFCLHT